METIKTPLQQKLSAPIQLPSLAKNTHILIESLADKSLNFQQLAKVIGNYPAITARLIFLANSPWSAPIAPILNIEQACSRLGTSTVKSISIAISIASSFNTSKCPSFNTEYFWTTSLLVSEAAGKLAAKLPSHTTDSDFPQTAETAGILHNLGLLWLANNLPTETDKAFQIVTQSPISVNDALKQCTGTDYCEMGGWVAKQMQLPEVLTTTMEHHLDKNYHRSSWEMSLIIGAASNMATLLHKQTEEIPINTQLVQLGINTTSQQLIYQQLADHFEKNQELAALLFER